MTFSSEIATTKKQPRKPCRMLSRGKKILGHWMKRELAKEEEEEEVITMEVVVAEVVVEDLEALVSMTGEMAL